MKVEGKDGRKEGLEKMGLAQAENFELKPLEALCMSEVLALVASAAECSWLMPLAGPSLQFCP